MSAIRDLVPAADFGPERARSRRALFWTGLFGLAIVWSGSATRCDVGELWSSEGLARGADLAKGALAPDLSTDYLTHVAGLLAESLGTAGLGLMLALLLGIPLAVVAAKLPELADPPGTSRLARLVADGLRTAARGALLVLRGIPDIVWAYAFVRLLGLGPGPAVIAIALSFAGIIGRLYGELLEAVDPAPLLALRASGAGRLGVLLFGALPQVSRQWVGYGLFRFECAVRSAAVLGVVGAGGLGAEIQLAVRYFEFDKLGSVLLVVVGLIVAMEVASGWLRRSVGWSSIVVGATAIMGLIVLPIPWSEFLVANNWALAANLLDGFGEPTLNGAFWSQVLVLIGETLGMAVFGTGIAALVAFGLAPLGSYALMVRGYLPDPPGVPKPLPRGPRAFLPLSMFAIVRITFQWLRAVPDLVWALIFVAWVGPGVFAGALAITVHTIGLLGRLFGEVYSDSRTPAAQALEASGSHRIGVWAFAVLPDVSPRLAAFTLFRLEVNLRATAVVGFVGAGGIGDAIHTALSLFHGSDLAGLLAALFAMIIAVDALSGRLRRKLLAPT